MKSLGKFKIFRNYSGSHQVPSPACPSLARDKIGKRTCLNRIGALDYLSDEFYIDLSPFRNVGIMEHFSSRQRYNILLFLDVNRPVSVAGQSVGRCVDVDVIITW